MMWKEVPIETRQNFIDAAADLMRRASDFETACVRVISEWPNSIAAAMTTPSLNYQAWIGHAACTLALGSPEHLTRQGWRALTEREQEAANVAAQNAIDLWRANNA